VTAPASLIPSPAAGGDPAVPAVPAGAPLATGAAPPTVPPAAGKRRWSIVRLILTALIIGGIFGGLQYFNSFRQQAIADYFAHRQMPPTPVNVALAKLETVPKSLGAIGTVEAHRQVTMAPEVAGRVVAILFESGARVSAGTPLVQLNDATEQAELAGLRAKLRLAELTLERARSLVSRQAGPQTNVDAATAQRDEILANIAGTEARIAEKLIRAPFDGMLGIRQSHLGAFVTPGTPLVTLTDLSSLLVTFTLPEQALAELSVGQAVQLTSDAIADGEFDAIITVIEPQVSADLRVVKAQARVERPPERLLPGLFASVRVLRPAQPAVVVVPVTAVDYTLYGDSVFVVRAAAAGAGAGADAGSGTDAGPPLFAHRIPVRTGDRFQDRVEVLGGLQPGERVVTSGQVKLADGAPVVISEATALAPPSVLSRY